VEMWLLNCSVHFQEQYRNWKRHWNLKQDWSTFYFSIVFNSVDEYMSLYNPLLLRCLLLFTFYL
jgi:hypothetical protein